MFILIKYNEFYEKNVKEALKYNFRPITLFEIKLNNKNQIKEDIQRLISLINRLKPKYSAIKIILEKIENSTIGTVNNFKNYFDIVIGFGGLNKINRFFLEQTQIDFLLDPQNSYYNTKIDFIHHFNSGINDVLCKLAKEKNIGFLFSLNFTYKNKNYIPKEIGRINQNLKFARKYKIQTHINFIIKRQNQIKSQIELQAITSLFDMSTLQIKENMNILENTIKSNTHKKSDKYICEGIEFE